MAAFSLSAQQVEKLPIDEAVRVGQLDNGLTYYIRHNEQPKQRCEFHIAQAVGAVLEEDNQNGLAHFLEHMAFNGTEHFPGKLIIEYFESIGVNFGGNINAYTSIDETVYRLSDVPTIREGIIDSALLVMHDWASAISLLGEEIDNERGVIREEWRTGATAQRRLWKQMQALKYPGTQYGKRDVIGDTAVINNFSYDALRAYYHKWYGPDNQAVIVVGDIDVDQIEAKIKALWADVPARENRGERPLHTVPFNEQPRVCIATDAEAPNTQITISFMHEQLPEQYQQTNVSYVQDVVKNLICTMLNNRLDEFKMDPTSSILYGVSYYDELVKLRDAFELIFVPKDGQETQAVNDMLVQLEKMKRYGFTNSELERAKAEYINRLETAYNGRNTRENISLAREYIRNFEDGEPIPGIEWEYEFTKAVVPMLPLASINQLAQGAFIHEFPTIAIQGPDKEGVNIPSEADVLAMLTNVASMEIAAPKEEVINTKLVKKAPKVGKIKKSSVNTVLGTTEWTLSNGVQVVIKPTKFKDNEIQLLAFSRGGQAYVNTADLASAEIATALVDYMGLGDFSMNDLQKALTGKTVGLSASIGANTEQLQGACAPKDLETELQLLYLSFTAPRRDEAGYQTLISMLETALKNRDANPKAIFQDSVKMMGANHSERVVIENLDWLGKVNLDAALRVYKARFANPADFTVLLVGDINPEDKATQKLICQWIGGLKTCKAREDYRDLGVRAPLGVQKNYFTREMQIHTASNRIQYTSYDMPYSLANELNMNMIGRILSTRYLESIREREGGSYGVGCYGYASRVPNDRAVLLMQFDTDPEKQEKLMSIIHEEVQTIIENGPLATDLQKEKESMLKDFQEDLEKNDWWIEDGLYNYYNVGQNLVLEYQAAVEAITAETVQETLRQLVSAGNVFEVVMTPAE